MITYWLYHKNAPIGAVRLPKGASDQDVRIRALELHDICPTAGTKQHQTPADHRHTLINADVRIFA